MTCNQYDLLTNRLTYTIQDIDGDTANALSLSVPDGWNLPQSDGLNL